MAVITYGDWLYHQPEHITPPPIDYTKSIEINSIKTPVLTSNGRILNQNNDLIDEFTKVTGAIATVFVKQDNDFFRIATSLQKTDGSKAMGTFLTDKSPAFEKIINNLNCQ